MLHNPVIEDKIIGCYRKTEIEEEDSHIYTSSIPKTDTTGFFFGFEMEKKMEIDVSTLTIDLIRDRFGGWINKGITYMLTRTN